MIYSTILLGEHVIIVLTVQSVDLDKQAQEDQQKLFLAFVQKGGVMTRLGDITNAYTVALHQFSECELGFHAEASSLGFPVGMWPKSLRVDDRIFVLSSYDGEAAIYFCDDGDKPNRVEVLQ